MWIIAINVEQPIIAQGAIDELLSHQTQHGKYKVNISLCRCKTYQRTYPEYIQSRMDQVRTVVSYIEVFPQISLQHQRTLVEILKVLRGNDIKKVYSQNMTRTNILFWLPQQQITSLMAQSSSVQSIIYTILNITVLYQVCWDLLLVDYQLN